MRNLIYILIAVAVVVTIFLIKQTAPTSDVQARLVVTQVEVQNDIVRHNNKNIAKAKAAQEMATDGETPLTDTTAPANTGTIVPTNTDTTVPAATTTTQ
jgi:hypothetical protein